MKITSSEFYEKLRPLIKNGDTSIWLDGRYCQLGIRFTPENILGWAKDTKHYNLIKKSIDNLKI